MNAYTEEEVLMRVRTLLVKWVAHTGSTVTYLAGVALEVAVVDLIKDLCAPAEQPADAAELHRPPDA